MVFAQNFDFLKKKKKNIHTQIKIQLASQKMSRLDDFDEQMF